MAKTYGSPRLGGPHVDVEARHVPLAALHLHRGKRFSYVYNFIDHWECELLLKGMLPPDPQRRSPIYLGGKRAAPPEDDGGTWAYMQRVDQHHIPLAALLPEHVTPELLFLETKWAALVSYAVTAQLLHEVLPIDDALTPCTIREHVFTVAERFEQALGGNSGRLSTAVPRNGDVNPSPMGP
jgi:Plasmid pRiA4b ORF-3-like protein